MNKLKSLFAKAMDLGLKYEDVLDEIHAEVELLTGDEELADEIRQGVYNFDLDLEDILDILGDYE